MVIVLKSHCLPEASALTAATRSGTPFEDAANHFTLPLTFHVHFACYFSH